LNLWTAAAIAQSVPAADAGRQALPESALAALQPQINILLRQPIEAMLRQFPEPQALRTEIRAGQLHPALRLDPCQRIEPFLPSSAQAWGKIQVGLRCLDAQARWQVYLPVEIKVFGPVLMTTRTFNAGEAVTANDVNIEAVELTTYAQANARQMLSATEQLNSHVLMRNLTSGQPLRRDFLRTPLVVASGDSVRVLMQGAGFAISAQGKAMQAGSAGQPIRVQIENGRILTGTARENHQVDIQL
jgi:flagella basal body P-ring formation protein FlgA